MLQPLAAAAPALLREEMHLHHWWCKILHLATSAASCVKQGGLLLRCI